MNTDDARPLYDRIREPLRRLIVVGGAAVVAAFILPGGGARDLQLGFIEVSAVPNTAVPLLLVVAAAPDAFDVLAVSLLHVLDTLSARIGTVLARLKRRATTAEGQYDREGADLVRADGARTVRLASILNRARSVFRALHTTLVLTAALAIFGFGVAIVAGGVAIDSWKIHDASAPISCTLVESAPGARSSMGSAIEFMVVNACEFHDTDGRVVSAHRHRNPNDTEGGWVADDAEVPDSVVVEAGAKVGPRVVLPEGAVVRSGEFLLSDPD